MQGMFAEVPEGGGVAPGEIMRAIRPEETEKG